MNQNNRKRKKKKKKKKIKGPRGIPFGPAANEPMAHLLSLPELVRILFLPLMCGPHRLGQLSVFFL
jgi:hypothetical protein